MKRFAKKQMLKYEDGKRKVGWKSLEEAAEIAKGDAHGYATHTTAPRENLSNSGCKGFILELNESLVPVDQKDKKCCRKG